MQSKSMRIFAPTGALGMGFLDESLARAVDFKPAVIGCDAGSTDSGPTHLGAASPKMSRAAIERDLRRLLRARDRLGVPLIIGSCGTAGTDSNVDWMREITAQLVREEGLKVRVGAVYAEQDGQALARRFDAGNITALPGAPAVDRGTFESCSHIVAMMGAEPLQQALDAGADVVLAGRASDTALFAALPLTAGLPAGPVWHCAKTIECGAVCATRQRADGMLAEIDEQGFTIEPAALDDTATPIGIAAHTLYENADPFLIREPSGTLNTTDAKYAPASNRATRVEGSSFEHQSYTIKLEGAAPVGYQTVVIGGVRDPLIIEQLDSWLTDMRAFFVTRAKELFGVSLDEDVKLEITVYGRDAVMGAIEPLHSAAHEVGLMFTVTAPTQVQANEVARFVAHAASHWPIPEWDGFISGIAFPFSPPEMDRGLAYRFALHHVVHPKDPFELFRFDYEDLAG
jgi:hypothetical protein